jgi:hypothetical protein
LKRLTPSMRSWLRIRQRRESTKRSKARTTVTINIVSPSDPGRTEYTSIRSRLPPLSFDYDTMRKHATFSPPEVFSLTRSYNETLAFIMDFQRIFFERKPHRSASGQLKAHYADFGRIKEIDAGAGLVLAAEIDRYAKAWGKPTRVYDHLWQDSVHDYFVEAGLFELLGIDPRAIRTAPSGQPEKQTLKFMSGSSATGKDALDLLEQLENLTSRALTSRPTAYAAIAEALANVLHAYPDWYQSWPYRSNQWWASGFWSPSRNIVGLQLYDHGAGIPATLPKQTHYPRILKFLDPEGTPAGLIAAALEYGRTSTGQPGRGKGLAEMALWIELTGTGFLRILSGAGQVTYRPDGSVEKRNYDVPFRGTLVEWEVSLGD